MTNRQKRIIVCIFVAVLSIHGISGFSLFRHIQNQDRKIAELQNEIHTLTEQLYGKYVNWQDEDFNYLAIGNSITVHTINSYWQNECGMAATKLENDYVHCLSKLLKMQKERVVERTFNFTVWETQSYDRGETLSLLDGMLSSKLDFVTIQLSENASDLTTFESDFEELIGYVQNSSPNARIVVIGDFWDENEKDHMKQTVCKRYGIPFVDLSEIKNQEKYQCGLGTTVYDKDGNSRIVEHAGVAQHPNDEAMQWIAQKVYETVKE